jgi:hypothetical protein
VQPTPKSVLTGAAGARRGAHKFAGAEIVNHLHLRRNALQRALNGASVNSDNLALSASHFSKSRNGCLKTIGSVGKSSHKIAQNLDPAINTAVKIALHLKVVPSSCHQIVQR